MSVREACHELRWLYRRLEAGSLTMGQWAAKVGEVVERIGPDAAAPTLGDRPSSAYRETEHRSYTSRDRQRLAWL